MPETSLFLADFELIEKILAFLLPDDTNVNNLWVQ